MKSCGRTSKRVVLTIDGRRFECDKHPYRVDFDTSHAGYRVIKLKAEAIGTEDGQDDAVLASFSPMSLLRTAAATRQSRFSFCGVFEPKIENRRGTWTPEMYLRRPTPFLKR